MDKKDEETHAMDKPKPLEVVSDGDLSEVKKDPVWKTWLEKEAPLKRMDARGRGIADEYHTGDVKTDKYGDTKTRKQEARNKPTKESVEQEESEAEREGKVAPSRVGRERFVRLEEGEVLPKKVNPDQDVDTKGKVIRGPSDRMDAVAHPSRLAGKIIGGKRNIQSGRRGSEDVDVGMKYPKMGEKEDDYNISDLANISETEAEKLGPKEEKRGGRIHKPTRRGYGGVKSDKLNRKEEKKSWEVWLDNVTKPIPDSKGGRGSFQHCIDANQDKNNPGGWCKQIERKIGKGLGALGEGKLNRKTGKPMKLKPRKITLDDFEHTNEPSYFNQVMSEEEKKKKEKKKIAEKPESDYYMDAGGNPQRKDKTDYFVEEIRSNIIYHNKILPIMGMIAGQAARGMGKMGKKIGSEVLEGAAEVGQGMLQGVGDEAEEEEQ